jgi:hypothetical protein
MSAVFGLIGGGARRNDSLRKPRWDNPNSTGIGAHPQHQGIIRHGDSGYAAAANDILLVGIYIGCTGCGDSNFKA